MNLKKAKQQALASPALLNSWFRNVGMGSQLYTNAIGRDCVEGLSYAVIDEKRITEVHHSRCSDGQLYGTMHYFTSSVGTIRLSTADEVKKFENCKEAEWKKFCLIANRDGIMAAMRQTCVR